MVFLYNYFIVLYIYGYVILFYYSFKSRRGKNLWVENFEIMNEINIFFLKFIILDIFFLVIEI